MRFEFAVRHPFGRRLHFNVAWGNAPGSRVNPHVLAEGHIHDPMSDYGLRPSKSYLVFKSWGDAPGYDNNGLRPKSLTALSTRLTCALLLLCFASMSVADERTLTPEQIEKLATDGELTGEAESTRPAKLPDLTKGDLAGGTAKRRAIDTWNLGPTGAIGMLVGGFQGDQIQVQAALEGSPAEGKLLPGDVILGAGGKKFVAGEHIGYLLGNAIIEAEKEENGGALKLIVWRDRNYLKRNAKKDIAGADLEELFNKARDDDSLYEWKPEAERKQEVDSQAYEEFPLDGFTTEVALKLRVLPPYSDTSPYDCPKAAAIRENAWKVLEQPFKAGKVPGGWRP